MNLWLVGLMGAGKTTVGRILASSLEREFIDTDDIVEQLAGITIPQLWLLEGESHFRDWEVKAVREASTREAVVSTGGGAPMVEANRMRMAESGRVVWLRAQVSTLEARVSVSEHRPLLAEDVGILAELALDREATYRGIADLVVDTDDLTEFETAEQIAGWWG